MIANNFLMEIGLSLFNRESTVLEYGIDFEKRNWELKWKR